MTPPPLYSLHQSEGGDQVRWAGRADVITPARADVFSRPAGGVYLQCSNRWSAKTTMAIKGGFSSNVKIGTVDGSPEI